MKDKDFDRDEAEVEVEETKVMADPSETGDGCAPERGAKTPKMRVRPKSKAVRAILDYLDANDAALPDDIGQVEVNDAVIKAVDDLYNAYAADGVVPTREGFAERCEEPPIGRTVLDMPEDPFTRKAMGRKAIVAVCAGSVAVLALVVGCVWFAVGTQPDGGPDIDVPAVSAMTDEKGDKDVSEPESKTDETEGNVGSEAPDEGTDAEEETSSDPSTEDGDGSTGSQSSGASSQPSGSDGAQAPSGGSTGGSASSQPSQPSHTHDWVPVTTTVHHDAVYQTVHHDAVVEYRSICNGCKADITGHEREHMKDALLNGNAACGAYTNMPVTVQEAYDENVLVSEAWDETVTTGYRCSTCGATK